MIQTAAVRSSDRETLADRLWQRRSVARDVSLVALGAILIALTARITIVMPDNPVPITGQTFGVLVVAGALGGRRGMFATMLYVGIGVMGLPAFAEGRGGIAVIASFDEAQIALAPTGGYLVGFVIASGVVGWLSERGWDRRLRTGIASMAIGNTLIYAIGLPWLAISTGFTVSETLAKGLVPFAVGDLIKLALAGALLPAGWWLVGRRR